jgi:hypothetical protein
MGCAQRRIPTVLGNGSMGEEAPATAEAAQGVKQLLLDNGYACDQLIIGVKHTQKIGA